MHDSRSPDPTDSWGPYWINLGKGHILRFQSYRNAYAHSARNKYPPIWFDDHDGTHLCEHVEGQELYTGHDPGKAVQFQWRRYAPRATATA